MASHCNLYKFKDITVIPEATDLVDIVLSRTQRKTPTEVHKQFKISRIRSFYLRKIKFCQQTIHDKLGSIISEFPRLDDIHPFYGDLCNVLYDRDHYKLALGQVKTTMNIVDNTAKEYVRLMKYSDSLYKCKMLKRAALGRMCTSIKKLQASFKYLEEVRQHLSRLPSINPNTRTLIICGYPNVGKSSFMNKVSNANVEVQPYAFTTKSLFVGHFDFAYSRFQVIDTPGILDRPLEERNTIEMTAITALAHIHSAILYFIDISETCGFSIDLQIGLYNSIKPLFKDKPVVLVINKIDIVSFDSLPKDTQEEINKLGDEGAHIVQCSTLTEEGVDLAKDKACSLILEQRIRKKSEMSRAAHVMDTLYIAKSVVNSNQRPPFIPQSVIDAKVLKELVGNIQPIKTEAQIEDEIGGPGVYSINLAKNYILAKEEWKNDITPEIWKGKNISDFLDPDIERKLQLLEEEENILLSNEYTLYDPDEKWEYQKSLLKVLHLKMDKQRIVNRLRKVKRRIPLTKKGKSLSQLQERMRKLNIKTQGFKNAKIRNRKSYTHLTKDGERQYKKRGLSTSLLTLKEKKPGTDFQLLDGPVFGRKAALRAQSCLRSLGYNVNKRNILSIRKKRNDARLSKKQDTLEPEVASNKSDDHSQEPTKFILTPEETINSSKSDTQKTAKWLNGVLKAEKLRRMVYKRFSKHGRKDEADRTIVTKKPRHLFTGKRTLGKTNKR